MDKIVVTGAGGQLGQEIKRLAVLFPGYDYVFLERKELSISDSETVGRFFTAHLPKYIVNCAAYTAVDKAESEKEEAYRVNAAATGILSEACRKFGAKFIHISTDYVFDGDATEPYSEESPTGPQSVYGASKLEGERLALTANPEAIIIRTAWVYSEFGKNFVKTMIRLMKEKTEIGVVSDQFGSPTYAADLAETILRIISSGSWTPGIYHYSNEGVISWFDFAVAIKEMTGSNCIVNPISTSQYPTPAKRPGYSVLNTAKIKANFGIKIPLWQFSLASCLERLGFGVDK